MTITDLAERMATQFDITIEAAEQSAENYLEQIEQVDRRTIDRNDITSDDADFVIGSFASERGINPDDENKTQIPSDKDDLLLDQLDTLSATIRDRQETLKDLTDQRNDLIIQLLDRGNSVASICDASGLTRTRVYAIKDARR
ncbi:hypothetical protein [Bifidobacterium biavatii]|uniref:Uncharacterized protein n=1 Tax=Bifidobacterium biavatii DSM 23969 TaxID=1437608 RepID=A0A086Z5X1_9BIFI|nr:hypothetical protein [Bifidobacterium biavatii]KFI41921.1 hypothetical protein BBIA_2542 [Bifidobacterium biavatii DSM 23969]